MTRAFQVISDECDNMKHILSNFGHEAITDCLSENLKNNQFKATLGETIDRDGKQVPTDTVLTDPEDFEIKERLDYIFWLNRAEASKVQVDIDKTFIEPQFAAPNSPFPQLSDHFGVSTELFLL